MASIQVDNVSMHIMIFPYIDMCLLLYFLNAGSYFGNNKDSGDGPIRQYCDSMLNVQPLCNYDRWSSIVLEGNVLECMGRCVLQMRKWICSLCISIILYLVELKSCMQTPPAAWARSMPNLEVLWGAAWDGHKGYTKDELLVMMQWSHGSMMSIVKTKLRT